MAVVNETEQALTAQANSGEELSGSELVEPGPPELQDGFFNWFSNRKVLVAAIAIVLILVAITTITFVNVSSAHATADLVNHTYQVQIKLQSTLLQLQDVETGQRGFLLTGDESYLQPYQTALGQIPQSLASLRQMTSDNPVQQQNLAALAPLVTAKLDIVKQTLDLRRSQGFAAALNVVLTNQGKDLMDSIRQVIATMQTEESNLLQQRENQQNNSDLFTIGSIFILVLLNFAFFVIIYLLFSRALSRRKQTETYMQGLNTRLEQRVRERTTQLEASNQNLAKEVTERKQAEEAARKLAGEREAALRQEQATRQEIQQAHERTARLQTITAALSSTLAVEQVAAVIVEQGTHALGATAGTVGLISGSADEPVIELVRRIGYSAEMIQPWERFSLNTNVAVAEVARTRYPVWIETRTQLLERYPEYPRNFNVQAVAALPLLIEGRVLGGLTFSFEQPRSFSEADRAFILTLADQCAQSLERARLYEVEQQAHHETQKTLAVQTQLDELKDLFMSVASHELRSPLTSVRGYAQLLQRTFIKQVKAVPEGQTQADGADKNLRNIEIILHQTRRMNDLINQMLDFSRIQSGKLELHFTQDANLVSLVERVVEQQRFSNDKHILRLQASDKVIAATYDEGRVEQVLDNLVSNALKYSPADTVVTVGVERREPASAQAVSSSESGRAEVRVWVRDAGYGISAEHQAHIFERFYRERTRDNARVDGLGLGLYISHEIIVQHGGRMWVESELGKGSTFYFALPLVH